MVKPHGSGPRDRRERRQRQAVLERAQGHPCKVRFANTGDRVIRVCARERDHPGLCEGPPA